MRYLAQPTEHAFMMKFQLLVCFVILLKWAGAAQIGITAVGTHSISNDWPVAPENFILNHKANFLRFGTTGIFDYVFDFKNDAIRFRPALQLMHTRTIIYPHYFQVSVIGLQGNIELALRGKRDKMGNKVPFRPYLQFSPGLALAKMRYERPVNGEDDEHETFRNSTVNANLGLNLFLEFKLSNLITLAPTAGYRIYPNLTWDGLTEKVTFGQLVGTYDATNWHQFMVGVRIGLYPF